MCFRLQRAPPNSTTTTDSDEEFAAEHTADGAVAPSPAGSGDWSRDNDEFDAGG